MGGKVTSCGPTVHHNGRRKPAHSCVNLHMSHARNGTGQRSGSIVSASCNCFGGERIPKNYELIKFNEIVADGIMHFARICIMGAVGYRTEFYGIVTACVIIALWGKLPG